MNQMTISTVNVRALLEHSLAHCRIAGIESAARVTNQIALCAGCHGRMEHNYREALQPAPYDYLKKYFITICLMACFAVRVGDKQRTCWLRFVESEFEGNRKVRSMISNSYHSIQHI
jgi:hypothetical protein